MKNARGFTLVEVLVVVIIITILTTIGTLTYEGYRSQSRDSKRQANANVIAESLERYYENNGEYPSIADVTVPNGTQVKALLNISDTSALVMPNAPANTTNSIRPPVSDDSLTPDIIAYDAKTASENDNTMCAQTGGACDSFTLRWKQEDGTVETIDSLNKDRIGVPQAPQAPVMAVSIVGGNVVGKVTHSDTTAPACAYGNVQYKILSNTVDFTPNWSEAQWQTSDSKSITPPVPSTEYFFYAKARCTFTDGGDIENSYIAKGSFYYTLATMTAQWNGTTGEGKLSSALAGSSICQTGQTAKYYIQSKVDTVTAAGQWLPASETWTTNDTLQVPNATNPRKISFRGLARCDVGGTAGTPTVMSNIDYLISAPATPVLTRVQTGSTVKWTWPDIVCPKDTTTIYKGSYGGNFTPKPAIDGVSSGHSLIGVFQNGFTYEFGVKASCGQPSAKILSSNRVSDTISASFVTINIGAGKFYTYEYSGSLNRIRGAARISSDSAGYCPTGSSRYLAGQFQHNNGGAGTDSNAAWNTNYPAAPWPGGDVVMMSGQILKAVVSGTGGGNDYMEHRAEVYCLNSTTGARSAQRWVDRYGTLLVYGQNDGGTIRPWKYQILCSGQSINGSGSGNEWLYCPPGTGIGGVSGIYNRNNTW